MFEKIKLKRKLEQAELKYDIAQYEIAENALNRAIAESRIVREDPDANQWWLNGVDGEIDPDGNSSFSYDHYEMLVQAYRFWLKDPYGRAIVRNMSKFVLGKGPVITSEDKNEITMEAWIDFKILNKWNLKEKELVKRVFRDGEIFIRWFVNQSNGDIRCTFIRANNIRNPSEPQYLKSGESTKMGIATDPNNIEDVKAYYRCDLDGKFRERIPAEEITHIKILSDSDQRRGISYLLVVMPMLKKYSDWMEDRIVLNKARSAIALIKQVQGTKSTVQSLRDGQASQYRDSDQNKSQAMARGTVITASQGVEYKMLSPQINAPDVKDDGRSMLLAVASGTGFPEMILTADYSNSNLASSMVAQNPFVREVEDWQDFFETYEKEYFARVIDARIKYGDKKLPKKTSLKISIEWPTLITADIEKNNKARETQFRNKIISRTTWQLKENLDPKEEVKNMEDEATKDIYKVPFNMPGGPMNQFSSTKEDELEDIDLYED